MKKHLNVVTIFWWHGIVFSRKRCLEERASTKSFKIKRKNINYHYVFMLQLYFFFTFSHHGCGVFNMRLIAKYDSNSNKILVSETFDWILARFYLWFLIFYFNGWTVFSNLNSVRQRSSPRCWTHFLQIHTSAWHEAADSFDHANVLERSIRRTCNLRLTAVKSNNLGSNVRYRVLRDNGGGDATVDFSSERCRMSSAACQGIWTSWHQFGGLGTLPLASCPSF